jgi:hypothetical protein
MMDSCGRKRFCPVDLGSSLLNPKIDAMYGGIDLLRADHVCCCRICLG